MGSLRTAGMMAAALACLVSLVPGAQADSIQLRDGRHLRGRYVGGTTTSVGFMTDRAVEYFPISSVLVLVFDPSEVNYKSGPLNPEPVRALENKRHGVAKLQRARLVSP